MIREALVGALSFGAGVLVSKMPIRLPKDVEEAVGRLRFVDAVENVVMTAPHVYGYGKEDSWEVWVLGYGLPDSLPNDVMVDVGKHATEGIHVTVMRGTHNPIEVWLDGQLIDTFPAVDIQNISFTGTRWLKLV